MSLMVIEWGIVGIKALQLILSLSILVVLHELGHFLPAKWFKCRVEKFYLFFDPYFSIFKKKIKDTEYGIGWLPLGGYVKISGMIDESMDKEQLQQPAQPWEFRSKPAWQRLIIMIGGVTVNLFLGFFIYAMILFVWGENYLPAKNVKGIYADSLGKAMGLKDGDQILSVNGRPVDDFFKFSNDIILNDGKSIEVNRGGEVVSLPVQAGTITSLIQRKGESVIYPIYPAIIDSLPADKKYIQGKLEIGDQVIGLNEEVIGSYAALADRKLKFKNKEVALKVLRNQTDTAIVKLNVSAEGNLGIYFRGAMNFVDFSTKKYGFFEAFPAGVRKGWNTLTMNIQNFKLLFTSKEVKASDSLGSFLSIGNMFGSVWDWERFWNMTALLSIVLAFMNILPIPALDGGHVIFTLYEMITGRKPSEKFLEYAQMVGMALLLGLMVYALGLDFWRYFIR